MNGVINVFKESGVTSFQVVSAVRRIFDMKKVGHLGTLDPIAEGVLPICIGYATKFADYISATEKEYISELTLGIKTDSYDITGETLAQNNDIIPTEKNLKDELTKFIGVVELTVPSFSAKKIDGVRAYKLAREGKITDAGVHKMNIINIDLLLYEYPVAIIKVTCEKGTYIRSIINTLGDQLGCFAMMTKLIRSRNGIFRDRDAYKLSALDELKDKGDLETAVIPVTDILTDWGRAVVTDIEIEKVMNGLSPKSNGYINLNLDNANENYFLFSRSGELIATAKRSYDNFTPLKINAVFK